MFHVADDSLDLLAEWRWLLGGRPRLVGWSAAGDLFARAPNGAVLRLDTGGGTLERAAPSLEAFEHFLRDPEKAAELLLLPVVRAFEDRRGPLGAGECLGFTTCQSSAAPTPSRTGTGSPWRSTPRSPVTCIANCAISPTGRR